MDKDDLAVFVKDSHFKYTVWIHIYLPCLKLSLDVYYELLVYNNVVCTECNILYFRPRVYTWTLNL